VVVGGQPHPQYGVVVLVFVHLSGCDGPVGLRSAGGWAANIGLNLAEGMLRLALFVAYILGISRMEAIRRVFEYHGAEHQVIYAFENGDPVKSDDRVTI